MTLQEFRNEFDLLYNNIMSNMGPGLDDYEVSVFLTQAQEELVSQLYAGGEGFEGFESTEKVRRSLASLLTRDSQPMTTAESYGNGYLEYDLQQNSDVLAIVSEKVKISVNFCCPDATKTKWVNVTPIKYDEINKVIENPFRRPNNFKVLRLDDSQGKVRIITKSTASEYVYEYLRRPAPIILTSLEETPFSINDVQQATDCELDESLHRPIIKYAVQLAAASWASNNKS